VGFGLAGRFPDEVLHDASGGILAFGPAVAYGHEIERELTALKVNRERRSIEAVLARHELLLEMTVLDNRRVLNSLASFAQAADADDDFLDIAGEPR